MQCSEICTYVVKDDNLMISVQRPPLVKARVPICACTSKLLSSMRLPTSGGAEEPRHNRSRTTGVRVSASVRLEIPHVTYEVSGNCSSTASVFPNSRHRARQARAVSPALLLLLLSTTSKFVDFLQYVSIATRFLVFSTKHCGRSLTTNVRDFVCLNVMKP